MAEELTVEVKLLLSRANKAVKDFKKNLGGLGRISKVVNSGFKSIRGAAGKLGGAFQSVQKNWLAALAAFLAIKAVISAFKEFIDVALVQKKAVDGLRVAVENTGQAYSDISEEVNKTTAALQDKTNFGDEEQIRALATLTAILGDSEKALAALPAVLDAAAFSGNSLASVSGTMGRALAGLVNTSDSVGVTFQATATFADRLNVVLGKVGGTAESQADPLKQLSDSFGDLKEAIGEIFINAEGFSEALEGIRERLKGFTATISANQDTIRGYIKDALLGAVTAFEVVVTAVDILIKAFNVLKLGFLVQQKAIVFGLQKIVEAAGIAARFLGLEGAEKSIAKVTEGFRIMNEVIDDELNNTLDGIVTTEAFAGLLKGAELARGGIEGVSVASKEAEDAINSLGVGVQKVTKEFKLSAVEIANAKKASAALAKEAAAAAKKELELAKAAQELKDQELALTLQTNDLREALRAIDFETLFEGAAGEPLSEADLIQVFANTDKVIAEAIKQGVIKAPISDELKAKLDKAFREATEAAAFVKKVRIVLDVVSKVAAGDIGATVGKAVGAAFGPAGALIGESLGGLAQQIGENGEEFAKNIVSGAEDLIAGLAEGIPEVIEVLVAAAPRIAAALVVAIAKAGPAIVVGVAKGVAGAAKSIGKFFTGGFRDSRTEVEKIVDKFQEMNAITAEFRDKLRETTQDAIDAFAVALGGPEVEREIIERKVTEAAPALEKLIDFNALEASADEAQIAAIEAAKEIEELGLALKATQPELRGRSISLKGSERENTQTQLAAAKERLKIAEETIDEFQEITEEERDILIANAEESIRIRTEQFNFERAQLKENFAAAQKLIESQAAREIELLKSSFDRQFAVEEEARDAAIELIRKKTAEQIVAVTEAFSAEFGIDPATFKALEEGFDDQVKAIEKLQKPLEDRIKEIDKEAKAFNRLKEPLVEARNAIQEVIDEFTKGLAEVEGKMRDVTKSIDDFRQLRLDVERGFVDAIREVRFAAEGPLATGAIEELRTAFTQAEAGEEQIRAANQLRDALVDRLERARDLAEEGIISNDTFAGIQAATLTELESIQGQTLSELDQLLSASGEQLAQLQTEAALIETQITNQELMLDKEQAQIDILDKQLKILEDEKILLEDELGLFREEITAINEQKDAIGDLETTFNERIGKLEEAQDADIIGEQTQFDTRTADLEKTLDADLKNIDKRLEQDLRKLTKANIEASFLLLKDNRIESAKFTAAINKQDIGKAVEAAQIQILRDLLTGQFDIPSAQAGRRVPRDELAFVHRGETIVPASRSGGSSHEGGGTMNITIQVQVIDAADFQKVTEEKIIPIIRDAIEQFNTGGLADSVRTAANG